MANDFISPMYQMHAICEPISVPMAVGVHVYLPLLNACRSDLSAEIIIQF